MTASFKDEAAKLRALELKESGFSFADISRATGIPRSTVGDFLNRTTHQGWWETREGSISQTDTDNPYSEDTKPSKKFVQLAPAEDPIQILTTREVKPYSTHLKIADTQAKEEVSLEYCKWIGEYIAVVQPDVIIHIGDHFDLPSLSSYDKGTKKAEGRRLNADINAGITAMNHILRPIKRLQEQQLALYGEVLYKPKMVFCIGNHEERLMRHVNANPELHGLVGYHDFKLAENGWEVYDFLEPAKVNGVTYIHFVPVPNTGKAYGGSAANILAKVGESFSMGHRQGFDIATRTLPVSGRNQWGLINGACYPHNEGYKGYTGNNHHRGLVVKREVHQGDYCPMLVSLNYLERTFGDVV